MAKERDRKAEVEIWLICYVPRDPLFFLVHSYIHYFLVKLVADATPRTRHATNTRIATTHPRRVLLLLSFSSHAALLNYFKPLFGRNMTAGGRDATLCESAWLVVSDRDKEGEKREKNNKKTKKIVVQVSSTVESTPAIYIWLKSRPSKMNRTAGIVPHFEASFQENSCHATRFSRQSTFPENIFGDRPSPMFGVLCMSDYRWKRSVFFLKYTMLWLFDSDY